MIVFKRIRKQYSDYIISESYFCYSNKFQYVFYIDSGELKSRTIYDYPKITYFEKRLDDEYKKKILNINLDSFVNFDIHDELTKKLLFEIIKQEYNKT